MQEESPAAMVDLEELAALLGIPPRLARVHLHAINEPPAATYHGKPLWLADVAQDLAATA
jgi:hypothetical protein